MKKISMVFVVLAVAIGAVGYWFLQQKPKLPEGIVSTNGRLELGRMDVATLYPGKIQNITVQEGDYVQANQVLAQLSSDEVKAQLNAAQAAKLRASSAVNRAEAETQARHEMQRLANIELNSAQVLQKDALVSPIEVQKRQTASSGQQAGVSAAKAATHEAKAAVQEATAMIERIEAISNDLNIRAPKAGRVEYKIAEVGNVVPAGGKIVTLLDPEDVYMTVFLPTRTIGQLKLGSEARIVLDGVDAVFPAKVNFISSEAQFTPKYVQTEDERDKLMYRVKLVVPVDVAKQYQDLFKGGLTGDGYVLLQAQQWPASLTVQLPKGK